jgi:undecaprenyl diphosphate synthase
MFDRFEGIVERGSPDEFLLRQIDPARLPRHVAVIMDGNGRWANRREKPRVSGHRAGVTAVRETVETTARLDIPHLTLYAFSTENWKRPRFEVETLMRLLREYIHRELRTLKENNIRFRAMGRRHELPAAVQRDIDNAERETADGTGMLLTVALNYSGRSELVDACRKAAQDLLASGRDLSTLCDADIERNLYAPDLPAPDFLIRTSGEMRVSNFMLWQIAYTEIYVTDTLWPDFRRNSYFQALLEFQRRERRYGGVGGRDEQNATGQVITGQGVR